MKQSLSHVLAVFSKSGHRILKVALSGIDFDRIKKIHVGLMIRYNNQF